MEKEQLDILLASIQAKDAQIATRDAQIDARDEALAKMLQKIDELTTSSGTPTTRGGPSGSGGGAPHPPRVPGKSPEEIHKDKILNVYQNLQKCPDIKSYKHTMQINVREWLKMFDTRLEILATAIDLKTDNIQDFEYVYFIKSKLDFDVIQELDLKFAAIRPDPYEWEQ